MISTEENNFAFIDGQNLYMGTTKSPQKPWKVCLKKFRIYLRDKYKVSRAYYFFGCINEDNRDLYEEIQEAGFVLMFREHNSAMLGKKKGNVDSDIIFKIMKKIYKKEKYNIIFFYIFLLIKIYLKKYYFLIKNLLHLYIKKLDLNTLIV